MATYLTYTTSDSGAADTRFEVVDGMLKLKKGVMLDHEMTDSVIVTVTVTDSGNPGLEDTAEVTVTVNDVNEAPMAEVEAMAVDENVKGATVAISYGLG